MIVPKSHDLDNLDDLDEVITTDSIPGNIVRAESVAKLRVISIAPLIEKIILRN